MDINKSMSFRATQLGDHISERYLLLPKLMKKVKMSLLVVFKRLLHQSLGSLSLHLQVQIKWNTPSANCWKARSNIAAQWVRVFSQ